MNEQYNHENHENENFNQISRWQPIKEDMTTYLVAKLKDVHVSDENAKKKLIQKIEIWVSKMEDQHIIVSCNFGYQRDLDAVSWEDISTRESELSSKYHKAIKIETHYKKGAQTKTSAPVSIKKQHNKKKADRYRTLSKKELYDDLIWIEDIDIHLSAQERALLQYYRNISSDTIESYAVMDDMMKYGPFFDHTLQHKKAIQEYFWHLVRLYFLCNERDRHDSISLIRNAIWYAWKALDPQKLHHIWQYFDPKHIKIPYTRSEIQQLEIQKTYTITQYQNIKNQTS